MIFWIEDWASMGDLFGALALMIAAFAGIYFIVWLVVLLPADMARARRRDPLIWVLVSIAANPLVAILLLIALGDAKM